MAIISKKFLRFISAFTLVSALFTLPQAFADCSDLLLGSSSISKPIYDQALHQALPQTGAMPEEVLAHLGSYGGSEALWQAISELGIRRVRLGAKYKISGWFSKTLSIKRPTYFKPENQAQAAIELARVLYIEKQRQLRYRINPNAFINESLRYSALLETFALPVVQQTAPQLSVELKKSFGFISYSLRSLLGMSAKGSAAWPKNKAQAGFQFAVSRLVTAMYLSLAVMTAAHLPEAYGTFSTVYKLRLELVEIGQQLQTGIPIDSRQVRLDLIQRYQLRIEKLQTEIEAGGAENPAELEVKIQQLKGIIQSLQDELKGP